MIGDPSEFAKNTFPLMKEMKNSPKEDFMSKRVNKRKAVVEQPEVVNEKIDDADVIDAEFVDTDEEVTDVVASEPKKGWKEKAKAFWSDHKGAIKTGAIAVGAFALGAIASAMTNSHDCLCEEDEESECYLPNPEQVQEVAAEATTEPVSDETVDTEVSETIE